MTLPVIAILMGGPSREREVSLNSGRAVLKAIDRGKYEVLEIELTQDKQWMFGDETLDQAEALERLKSQNATVFIALHGSFGEDGTLQAIFDEHQIAYTGSNAATSRTAMDKLASNKAYTAHKLTIPKTVAYKKADGVADQVLHSFSLPVIVKPVAEGSSFGVSLVKQTQELPEALQQAFDCGDEIMVQDYIKGRELSCGVLEVNGKLTALPPTEVIPTVAEFFTYEAKYTAGGSKEITPAQFSSDITDKIAEMAVVAHAALGCKTYSRTDMIVKGDQVYVIETNTLPGMTEFSILPQQAQAAGISFTELVDHIIAGARV